MYRFPALSTCPTWASRAMAIPRASVLIAQRLCFNGSAGPKLDQLGQ
jgi:hypothetical protein